MDRIKTREVAFKRGLKGPVPIGPRTRRQSFSVAHKYTLLGREEDALTAL
jgi:hypothetical protein